MQSDGHSILVEHGHERAIVSFVAPVTESSVIELVRTVNELERQRFYRHVELQIASPGGQVLALQYFLEALAYWKDRGLRLTTLALTSCSSAAAVMLSLGDRRKASPTLRSFSTTSRGFTSASPRPLPAPTPATSPSPWSCSTPEFFRRSSPAPRPTRRYRTSSARKTATRSRSCASPWAIRRKRRTASVGSRSGSRRRRQRRRRTGRHAGPRSIASCARPTGPSPGAWPGASDSSTRWCSRWRASRSRRRRLATRFASRNGSAPTATARWTPRISSATPSSSGKPARARPRAPSFPCSPPPTARRRWAWPS